MLEPFVFAIVAILVIAFSCEPAQSFVVDVDAEGVYSQECNVYPEVELEVVDEQRIANVVADNQGGVFLEFGEDGPHLGGHCDAFPLRSVVRFDDVGDAWRLSHFFLEERELLREDEGFGEEVKVGHAMAYLHLGDAFVHEVFAG